MATPDDEQLALYVASYLDAQASVPGAAATAAALRGALSLESEGERLDLGGGHDLLSVFTAGKGALGLATPAARAAKGAAGGAAEGAAGVYPAGFDPEHAMFKKFLKSATAKGFFGECEESSAEYQVRYEKAVARFMDKFGGKLKEKAAAAAAGDDDAGAEALKEKGNDALRAQDFEAALDLYGQAVRASPNGPKTHIYHCNRAAALSHLERYDEAVEACEAAVVLNAGYSKAHSRLGFALMCLKKYDEAIASYNEALKIDPANQAAKIQVRFGVGDRVWVGGCLHAVSVWVWMGVDRCCVRASRVSPHHHHELKLTYLK